MVVFDRNALTDQAQRQGWEYVRYEHGQGQLVFLERWMQSDKYMLHIWCTTGTVGSYLDHPRQGHTQLFRRNLDWGELLQVMNNPRVHTGAGYHERAELDRREQAPQQSVPCPGCGKLCKSMAGTAGHFESGACSSCPGRDNAMRATYGQVRQLEHAGGHERLLTGGRRLLTNQMVLNEYGETDYSYGYEAGGQNYACPNPACRKGFCSSQGLISHCEAKHACRGFLGLVYGG